MEQTQAVKENSGQISRDSWGRSRLQIKILAKQRGIIKMIIVTNQGLKKHRAPFIRISFEPRFLRKRGIRRLGSKEPEERSYRKVLNRLAGGHGAGWGQAFE